MPNEVKLLPTHRCLACEASWVRHDDGNWSLMSNHCGQCCDNAPMGGQMIPVADMRAWKPVVEEFRKAASVRGMSDMRAYLTVRALVAKAPESRPTTVVTDEVVELRDALGEAKLQLEYLESRWPTGTTPAILARIDSALASMPTVVTGEQPQERSK